jgi:hypothetical protein
MGYVQDIFPEKKEKVVECLRCIHGRFLIRCCSCLELAVGGAIFRKGRNGGFSPSPSQRMAFYELKARLLGITQTDGLIRWNSGAVDGSFSPGGGRRCGGYKGKDVLIHLFVDAEGMPISVVSTPVNADERKQVP